MASRTGPKVDPNPMKATSVGWASPCAACDAPAFSGCSFEQLVVSARKAQVPAPGLTREIQRGSQMDGVRPAQRMATKDIPNGREEAVVDADDDQRPPI